LGVTGETVTGTSYKRRLPQRWEVRIEKQDETTKNNDPK